MPDLKQRFHKDMLVLSSPLAEDLARQGIDVFAEGPMLLSTDEEAVSDDLRLQEMAGVPCLVTPTPFITRAQLSHARLEDKQEELAQKSLDLVKDLMPQHVVALIGPTGLPIDPESQASLKENRNQYSDAARAFGEDLDAFFLDGMASIDDVRCALMGVRRITYTPVFCSVNVDADGNLLGRKENLVDAVELMEDLEADVVGFRLKGTVDQATRLIKRVIRATELPVLVQLDVTPVKKEDTIGHPELLEGNPFSDADSMITTGLHLRSAGAQFVRATGQATAAYAGALAAAVNDTDCIR